MWNYHRSTIWINWIGMNKSDIVPRGTVRLGTKCRILANYSK